MTASTAPTQQAVPGLVRLGRVLLNLGWPVTVLFALVGLGIWQVIGQFELISPAVLPPTVVAGATAELIVEGELWGSLATSLSRSFTGYFLGAGFGVLLGLIAGTVKVMEDLIELPIAFTYPIPKIALFPVFAVWLGFTDVTRILVITLACFYPAYLNALNGTRGIDRNLLWVAQNVGASRVRTFLQVILPAALPRTFTGLQISLAISFILLFAVETIGFSDGVAADLFRAFRDGFWEEMYAGVVVLGIAGFLANSLLVAVGRRLLPGVNIGIRADDE